MAGAGQPWYMPLLWPVAHVTNAIFKPETEKVPKNVAVAKLDLVGHLTAVFAAIRSFTLAYIAIYWLYDDFDYPAFGAGTCKITVRRTHCGKIPLFVRKVNFQNKTSRNGQFQFWRLKQNLFSEQKLCFVPVCSTVPFFTSKIN